MSATLPERLAGPDAYGHFSLTDGVVTRIFPGWNTPTSVATAITKPITSYMVMPNGFRSRMIWVLEGSPYEPLARTNGVELDVAAEVDTAHLGVEVGDVSIEATMLSVNLRLAGRERRIHRALDFRNTLRSAVTALHATIAREEEARTNLARWSALATRIAAMLPADALAGLKSEIDAFWTQCSGPQGKVGHDWKPFQMKMRDIPGLPNTSATFKVGRTGEVLATLRVEGIAISETSVRIDRVLPETFVRGLVGRNAGDVVDHPLLHGRRITKVTPIYQATTLTLAAA